MLPLVQLAKIELQTCALPAREAGRVRIHNGSLTLPSWPLSREPAGSPTGTIQGLLQTHHRQLTCAQ